MAGMYAAYSTDSIELLILGALGGVLCLIFAVVYLVSRHRRK